MIDVKTSFGDRADFDPPSMQLDMPFDTGWTTHGATDLDREFEDHRMQCDRTVSPRADWPFLAFCLSCAAGVLSIAFWSLI